MSLDRLVSHLIEAAKNDERVDKPQPLNQLRLARSAGDLIKPAQYCAAHHRVREKHYTAELEKAEKDLRDKGVTVDVTDTFTGIGGFQSFASGAISASTQQFQAKIDQALLDKVRLAKNKMLEHRNLAEKYGKFERAFRCCPDLLVELSIEDVHFFRLES